MFRSALLCNAISRRGSPGALGRKCQECPVMIPRFFRAIQSLQHVGEVIMDVGKRRMKRERTLKCRRRQFQFAEFREHAP